MLWCVVFALYLSVDVGAHTENPERGNFTNVFRDKRYSNLSHQYIHTLPPPPPTPTTPYDQKIFPPFGTQTTRTRDQNPISYGPNPSEPYMKGEDPCNPHFSEKPEFLIPGRRVSEAKCMDYIWTLKRKREIEDKRVDCEIQTELKEQGYLSYIPAAVGGRAAIPGEFPHMGAVGWLGLNGEWLFRCGSSLISPKFVLTAAHCSKAPSSTDLADQVPKIVRLNIDFASLEKEILKYDTYIQRIIVHPNYNPPKKYYDIALMELDKEVGFTQMVQPACLWTKPDTSNLGDIATLTGWGVLQEGSLTISSILQAAVVDVIGKTQCDSLLAKKRNRHWSGLQDHQICAGKLAGGVDACQGDSGGPLQMKVETNFRTQYKLYYIVGVTAFGFGCGRRNLPGVYTRVSSFADWIESVVWE